MKRLYALILFVTAFTPLFAQESERDLFKEAENRFLSEDYVLAVKMYDEFLQRFPLSQYVPDIQFRKAVALYRIGRSEESLLLFQTIQQRYRSTRYFPLVHFWKGLIRFEAGAYDEALVYFSDFLKTGTESLLEETLLYMARAAEEMGKTEDAEKYLSRLLERQQPSEGQYAFTLYCSLLIREGRYEDALEKIRQADLEGFQREWLERVELYRAEALWNTGEQEEAALIYSRLLASAPEISSTAFRRLFSWYRLKGEEEELRDILARAESTLAGRLDILSEFWLRVGIESFKEEKHDLALVYLQRIWNALDRRVVDPLVPLYLSQLYALGSNLDRGVGILEEFRQTSVEPDEYILFQLSGLYLQKEQWIETGEICTEFLKNFPESVRAGEISYRLAFSLHRRGLTEQAVEIIRTALARGTAVDSRARLLKLGARLQQILGNPDKARELLEEYIALHPEDHSAALQIAEIAFQKREYDTVLERTGKTLEEPGKVGMLSRYLAGLSLIPKQMYPQALDRLQGITRAGASAENLEEIIPYALFYRGWIYYRTAEYGKALGEFETLVNEYPAFSLTPEALYLAGWCSFSLEEYGKALIFFGQYNGTVSGSGQDRGLYMYAKSYEATGQEDKAAVILRQLYSEKPTSEFADDALFEHAGILERSNRTDDALSLYDDLHERYPDSPFGEESYFRKAELLYRRNKWREARDAYYRLRVAYPEGNLFDAALYWGGMASLEAREPFGAVMLWEILIRDRKDSSFRPEALRKTAEVYRESGDYSKAFSLYSEFLSVYPDDPLAGEVDRASEEVMYLLQGREEEEADLTVTINRSGGASSREGREALVELARLYLYRGGTDREKVPELLAKVIEKKETDPELSARAQYYLGEYYFRKNDVSRAWREFLTAATMNPADKDLMAMALFRAFQVAKTAKKETEAKEMLERLETHFPDSSWTVEAQRLMGASQ
ncbi:MAG: tetratricopeptide repeat protein [Spirochaetales bacterium]|nr:tetratricopeptide repeat protein [Spirochaetales bacterium]